MRTLLDCMSLFLSTFVLNWSMLRSSYMSFLFLKESILQRKYSSNDLLVYHCCGRKSNAFLVCYHLEILEICKQTIEVLVKYIERLNNRILFHCK
uniref:Secreted protein n=1 Tax=Parascaris univalens TaxID=6257 RepID=A0A915BLB4_PARUN